MSTSTSSTTLAHSLPVQRIGEVEDVALAFLYLMKQSFGTGQSLLVDGGTVLV
jgi:NAD(P)-dependent dehydrogenase (short-subunit alcohol dehydrogenase family)